MSNGYNLKKKVEFHIYIYVKGSYFFKKYILLKNIIITQHGTIVDNIYNLREKPIYNDKINYKNYKINKL